MHCPGTGDRLEQFLRDTKKQPHQPARGDHGDIAKLRDPGRLFSCDPEPADFSCHRRAEVLEHDFPYPWTTAGSYLNWVDGAG